MSQNLVYSTRTWLTEPLAITDDTIYVGSVNTITNTIVQNVTAPVAVLGIMRIGLLADKNSIVRIEVYNNATSALISSSNYKLVIENTSPILQITSGPWIATGNSLTITTLEGNIIYINGEQIKYSSADTISNTLSGLSRGQNITPIQYLISKYTEVWGLLPQNKMNNVGYVKTWNSYNYNAVIGDPLQISCTPEARFLTGNKCIKPFPIISPIPPSVIYSITVAPTSWSVTLPRINTTTTTTAAPGTTTTTTAAPSPSGPVQAIFGFGLLSDFTSVNVTNLVSNTGVVATDTTGVGTARSYLAAAGYGGDRAIFGFGFTGARTNITNLVSNTGVVATDTAGVGTARNLLAAAGYGGDRAIFGFGVTDSSGIFGTSITNLVSNTGVVATDTAGVGTARNLLAAAGYGNDKAIFGFGVATSLVVSITNLVSSTGVVAADQTALTGTARSNLAAAGYGGDRAIFGFGTSGSPYLSLTNLVSNTGVVATDTTGVGTPRATLAAAGYGNDKAIFGFGTVALSRLSTTNLVNNLGVVAADQTALTGTARSGLAAAGYGT